MCTYKAAKKETCARQRAKGGEEIVAAAEVVMVGSVRVFEG